MVEIFLKSPNVYSLHIGKLEWSYLKKENIKVLRIVVKLKVNHGL